MWQWFITSLANFELKNYATAIAIFITSLIAVVVTIIHNRNQLKLQREEFSHQKDIKRSEALTLLRLKSLDLQESFWKDQRLIVARHLIANDHGYAMLEQVLAKRNLTEACTVSTSEYEMLEAIDAFYAAVARLHALKLTLNKFQGNDADSENMIAGTFGFWMQILQRDDTTPGQRRELKKYVERFWPSVSNSVPSDVDFGALRRNTI